MAVIGFNLKKILVERKGLVRGEVKVGTKMNIVNVKKEETKIITGKNVLALDFEFIIKYMGVEDSIGNVANINFEGTVLYLIDPKETKKILEDWKKKELPEELKLKVLNTILAKCNIKALVLEEDLGLPPHIPLPKFKGKTISKGKTEKRTKSYTG